MYKMLEYLQRMYRIYKIFPLGIIIFTLTMWFFSTSYFLEKETKKPDCLKENEGTNNLVYCHLFYLSYV